MSKLKECDLVMKGGITSGVVYPKAIQSIAKEYRLRQVGGSSAGAIAAVFASAAEYRRQTDHEKTNEDAGFAKVGELAQELPIILSTLFQPAPALKLPFLVIRNFLRSKRSFVPALFFSILQTYWFILAFSLTISAIFALLAFEGQISVLPILFALLLGIIIWLFLMIAEATYLIRVKFPKANFGLCPGIQQPNNQNIGLTNWIVENIEKVAGRCSLEKKSVADQESSSLLTCGDLKSQGIELAVMTTDLSAGQPYRLPFWQPDQFFVSKNEMKKLFPETIIKHICKSQKPEPTIGDDCPNDLYPMPLGDNFPVAMMARLSLSFPGLFSAVPVWKKNTESDRFERHLFSDGGIASNFPIHFFDTPLPERPTFGIRFAETERFSEGAPKVHLAKDVDDRSNPNPRKIASFGEFIGSVFFTAKDWKDDLQADLLGYPERIVEVRLDKHQGGFNLWMPKHVTDNLLKKGEEAGTKILNSFCEEKSLRFEMHKLNRVLSFVPAAERMLALFHRAYSGPQNYPAMLKNEKLHSATNLYFRENTIKPLMEELSTLGKKIYSSTENNTAINDVVKESSNASLRLNPDIGAPPQIPAHHSSPDLPSKVTS